MSELLSNEWVITIAGGIAVLIFAKIFIDKKKRGDLQKINKTKQTLTQNQNVTQNVFLNAPPSKPKESENNSNEEKTKLSTQILFVDDDRDFGSMVKILKDAGWKNTKLVADIKNADSENIKNTDIFFIDIRGVGTNLTPKDEGLGLAVLLKQKYPSKKVVIYSADPEGDRSDPALREADGFLAKNAEPYQFIHLIEKFTEIVE